MVEPTYVDIWNQNRLPKSVFVVGFTSLEDNNVGVNGLGLPNFWDIGPDGDSEKNINLSEKNKDWLPFFVSIKAANDFFAFLTEAFVVEDPWDEAGLIFNPMSNVISGYRQSFENRDFYHVVNLGNFSLTNRKLRMAIRKLGDIEQAPVQKLNLKRNNPSLPSNVNSSKGLRNWDKQGPLSARDFSPEIIEVVRQMFSKMYGHPVSKLVTL